MISDAANGKPANKSAAAIVIKAAQVNGCIPSETANRIITLARYKKKKCMSTGKEMQEEENK
jgi:hypothetical protein